MNEINKYLISIIKAALTDYKLEPPKDGFDWGALLLVAKKHRITALVGAGMAEIMDCVPRDIKEKFQTEIKKSILLDLNQEYEAERIFGAFDKKNLKHMLMKGYNVKKMYPEAYMRYMCDIDILIDNNDYEQYETVMAELGYEKKQESNHEHIFVKKPMVNVELHKSIVPSYNTDLYEYYGTGWKYAKKINDNERYNYSLEDQFVFLIVHLAKHYQSSGIGISHFIDIYVMMKKCELDQSYINIELCKLGLEKFYNNVLRLIEFWFSDENAKSDELMQEMSEYVIASGAYGNFANRAATETMKGIEKYGNEKAVKRAKLIEIAFPSCKALSENFPILKKCILLYPVCLVYRNVRALFFRRGKVKNYMESVRYSDNNHMNRLSSHLSDVGFENITKGSEDL